MDLLPLTIDRLVGGPGREYGVVLKAPEKTFVIYIGEPEAAAIMRELKGISPQRPMSHDLVCNLMAAFDVNVRTVVISSLVKNIFCATMLLDRVPGDEDEMRNEVRLDLRASDAIIVALKTGSPLMAMSDVVETVEDISHLLSDGDGPDIEPPMTD